MRCAKTSTRAEARRIEQGASVREVSETEPVGLGHEMEEGAEERREWEVFGWQE